MDRVRGRLRWAAVLAWFVCVHPERSKLIRTTKARKADVRFDRVIPDELVGGARRKTRISR